jgi:colicin import membrane protein
MRANSPSAVFASLTLHGAVVALILVVTMYVARQEQRPPVIFELVAGPPTAPNELVAPALGNTTNKLTVEIPKPPEKVEPVVQEVVKPPEPEAVTPPPKPAAVVTPKPAVVKPDNSITKEFKKKERISYQQYLKSHPTPKQPANPPAPRTANVPRIDAQGIANGVRSGSTANTKGGGGGKALTREEHDEFDTYYSFLRNALKEAHEPPPGVSDQLEAKVTFDITAAGAILYPRISKSSGDRSFDQSVIEAFRRVKSIGPTPNGKPDTAVTLTFRMRDLE